MSNNQFDWIPIYKEFAEKLLPYKTNRSDLIDKVKQIFVLSGIDMPKLEKNNELVDIDPFTVYSLFNKTLLPQNRTAILSAVKELFDLSESLPTSYDGIPVLNPQRAAYYPFIDERNDSDIDDHWNLFEAALKYASDSSEQNRNLFSDAFTKSVKVKYVGNAKLSMGLFWIAPESYINLDSCNVKYIYKSNILPEELVKELPDISDQLTGPVYLDIIGKIKAFLSSGSAPFSNFVELSFAAWLDSSKTEKPSKDLMVRYWLYSPGENACKWDEFRNKGIMAINWTEMGDLSLFSDREEMRSKMKDIYHSDSSFMHDSLCTWEFAFEIKPGDVVFVKKGLHDLVGRGIVTSQYMFDESASEFGHIREVNWTHKGEWKNAYRQVLKTLTEITKEKDYKKLEALFDNKTKKPDDKADVIISSEEWWPAIEEYNPGISKGDWLNILNDEDLIGPVWGGALAAFYGMGGAATCSQVGKKYNRSPYGVSGICSNLGRSIYKKTNCPILLRENGQKSYWPIMFQGKNAGPDIEGAYIWKLRPELFEALTEFDIMRFEWDKGSEPLPDPAVHYWWLNANPKIWSIAGMAVGEVQSYTLYNDNGNKRRIFQNFLDANAGDVVIGYESSPVKQIVALAKVSAPQDGKEIWFEKTESLSVPIDIAVLKEYAELKDMECFQNPQGSLFKLTQAEYELIMDLIREENPLLKKVSAVKYTEERFLKEVYMTSENYRKMRAVLEKKRNIILQGAPGVGKTYAAKRLAYSIIGEVDDDRIEFVQFHQNYSYEDFVMGYKPVDNGFELKQGVFYRFCQKAASHPDKEYFFIIDEINRGNMSKIFGELLMLIEKDYRGEKATLAYNGLPFSVPEKLYIIGMMNTADRSLAMIDYALRRRFSFFDMEPGFDSEQFIKYQKELNSQKLDELIVQVKILNQEITADKSLGKGFCIGHSYFCGQEECTDDWLYSVVNYDILPMLREYWFDDAPRVQKWEGILNGVLQ